MYNPKTGTFTATGPMADKRVSQTATLLPDGRVLIAGGYDGRADVDTAELYDATTGTFRPNGPGGGWGVGRSPGRRATMDVP